MKVIPIFFATDNNYAPYLAVTLKSLLVNSSKKYFYKIYVLTTKLHPDLQEKINKVLEPNSSIEYVNVENELIKLKEKLFLRDYYSFETYYRFFIPDMFPQYKKVIYLDCDIIVKEDISIMYNTNINHYLVGAVSDQAFRECGRDFIDYAEKVLDINVNKIFNAGVLLINSEMFRTYDILGRFTNLLSKYKFRVTQDEDYLNVLCKDKVKYLHPGWNKMPFEDNFKEKDVKLIHYNLHLKPWHYDNIRFQNYFWEIAEKTEFYEDIKLQLKYYSDENKEKDKLGFEKLRAIAVEDINKKDNYKNILCKEHRIFYYVNKTFSFIIKLPIIAYFTRVIRTKGYKIIYGYKNRKVKRAA